MKQGHRVYFDTAGPISLKDGEYMYADGRWWAYAPGVGLSDLSNHDVTEHEDGTITVSPSILVTGSPGDPTYHGYLVRGVWQEC